MKWVFYLLVFIYMFYRAVYGIKTIHKETRGLLIDQVDYGTNKTYFEAGARETVVCKATSKNQKVEWVDPSGKIIQRVPSNRIFTQENFVPYLKNRIPALVLTFTQVAVSDTGVWTCRSGDVAKDISLCIIESSEFVDTPTEVTVERGRSITLTCQAKGEPEPRLSWNRKGEVITDQNLDSKYHVMTKYNSQGFESLLTITALEPEDSGEYVCDAIQESPRLDDCSASTKFNIMVHVKYAPIFEGGNETSYVASKENESVDLICAAEGYPEPTYKWFLEVGDSEDDEYSKDSIKYEDNKAILTIVANSSTFGQRYKCQASNVYGKADNYYVLLKLEKPKKPSEINLENATHDALILNLLWHNELFSTVDEITVQYMELANLMKKKVGIPREIDWKKSEEITIKADDGYSNMDHGLGLTVILPNLDEETQYWVRIQADNEAGTSPWSDPVLFSTVPKPEELEVEETNDDDDDDDDDEPEVAAQISDGTFYGIFFAGGVIIIAIGCMFAMRMV